MKEPNLRKPPDFGSASRTRRLHAVGRYTTFLALPVVVFFEAAAWYGARALFARHLVEGVDPVADIAWTKLATSILALVGVIITGVGALGVGPWPFVSAGALLVAVGAMAIAILPTDATLVAASLMALGWGLSRPALWGAAARAFGDDREHLRSALFLLLYGSITTAAYVGGWGASELAAERGTSFGLGASGALSLVAFILAAGAGVAVWATREKGATPAAPQVRGARLAALAGLIVVVGGTYTFVAGAAGDHFVATVTRQGYDGGSPETLFAIGPLTTALVSVLVAGLFGVLHVAKLRVPVLLFASAGLVLLGGGLALLLFLPIDPPAAPLWLTAVLIGTGEILVAPLVLSRVIGGLPARFETLVAAVWFVVGALPTVVMGALAIGDAPTEPSPVLAWVNVGLAILVGFALAGVALPLRAVLAPKPDPESGPESAS